MKGNDAWKKLIIAIIALLVTPFFIVLISNVLSFNLNFLSGNGISVEYFLSIWITMVGVVAAVIGLYHVKVTVDKHISTESHNKKILLNQQRQLNLMSQQLITDSYNKFLEYFSMDNDILRMAAISNLYLLALQYPSEYKIKVCELFCRMIKIISLPENFSVSDRMPKYVYQIVDILFCKENNIFKDCNKNLDNACFYNFTIKDAVISNASFRNVKFIECNFHNTNIENVDFIKATMKSVVFRTCDIAHSNFHKSIIQRVTFDKTCLSDLIFNHAEIIDTKFKLNKFYKDSFDECIFRSIWIIRCKFDLSSRLSESYLCDVRLIYTEEKDKDRFIQLLSETQKNTISVSYPIVMVNMSTSNVGAL